MSASADKTAQALSHLLADSYTLYVKTHNFHWNVTGPMFTTLHTLFETQYTELALAVDEIAERIRALGVVAPSSYAAMDSAATLKSDASETSADGMVADLLKGHETVIATIRKTLDLAGEHGDEATADVLTPRLTAHEKTAWMLRSTLG